MCKSYATRFTCGHSKVHVSSTCRGTFASSLAPTVPRCSPTNDVMVMRSTRQCQDCEYTTFCNEHQDRLDEMTSNRDALTDLLDDFESADDLWEGEEASDEPSSSMYGCDANSIRRQRDSLNDEISAIQSQYDAEAWARLSSGSPKPYSAPRKTQRRRAAPRSVGASRLSAVTLSSELPTPEPEVVLYDEEDADESFPGDSDGASTVSASSLASPVDDADAFTQPEFFKSSFNSDSARTGDWIRKLQDISSADMTQIHADDEDAELFPAWGNA